MKISVVGCGKVGSTVAYTSLLKGLTDDIVLVDASCDKARGEALDLLQCRSFAPQANIRQGQLADTAGSDIVVVTAGIPRKADEPRVLLLSRNAALIGDIVRQVAQYSPNCILFMITNPLDVMTQLAFKASGLPRERVIGMGTVLDTSRYRASLARDFGADARDIDA
jgi:L-lactate dehydrogenase